MHSLLKIMCVLHAYQCYMVYKLIMYLNIFDILYKVCRGNFLTDHPYVTVRPWLNLHVNRSSVISKISMFHLTTNSIFPVDNSKQWLATLVGTFSFV